MQRKKCPLTCTQILRNKYHAEVRVPEQPGLQQPEMLLPITPKEPVPFLHCIYICTSTHVHTKALQLQPIWTQTRWLSRRRPVATHFTLPECNDQPGSPPWHRKESAVWNQFNWEVSENTQPFSVALSLNWLRLQALPNPTPDVAGPAARVLHPHHCAQWSRDLCRSSLPRSALGTGGGERDRRERGRGREGRKH